ncbi:baseplate J/gp47 family protein [Candidatus Sodalis sp. SoCistrobi]|uniref:baseplate J/gp47 family protein n=1 Tax=Candidatus Sodalis sp. SoCistrobi TaxID=1922216 RepID=UPI00093DB675|nr:baseplate J/gp47 family protein [Candidatus Sodalis sp. SoCistrobi]
MAHSTPTHTEIADTLLRDIRNQLPDADTGPDSDYAVRANAIASALQGLYQLIHSPAGGNQYDYHRWAVSLPGVTEAYVYPLRRGYGTVDVVIVTHNDLPAPETIKAVQSYIDEMRPVTAKDCLVLAPEVVKAGITARVSLSNLTLEAARQQITTALSDYFNRLAPGEVAVRTQLGALISEVVGVVDYQLLAPSANVVPVVNKQTVQWIRAGTITVEKMP